MSVAASRYASSRAGPSGSVRSRRELAVMVEPEASCAASRTAVIGGGGGNAGGGGGGGGGGGAGGAGNAL